MVLFLRFSELFIEFFWCARENLIRLFDDVGLLKKILTIFAYKGDVFITGDRKISSEFDKLFQTRSLNFQKTFRLKFFLNFQLQFV